MTRGPEKYSSRRDTLIFAACLLLSLAARIMPEAWQAGLADGLRQSFLGPFLAIQRQTEELKTYRARLSQVIAERDSAVVARELLEQLREENAQLRAALQLSARLPVRHVSAEVLHQALPTDGYTLLLAAGSNRGIRPLSPVIAPGGLVGLVRSVTPNTSVVVTWAHPDFRASAMTEGGEVYGIVAPRSGEGPTEMLLELRGVPYTEKLEPGTRVYTSGLAAGQGGVFPRGIPIGSVLAVGEELEGWARTYLVLPRVHPAAVSHVVVLLDGAGDWFAETQEWVR
ncbi:Cell shape-determining protein MreC [bacterium HR33]|nr:Cell shape-determining protein MreC [bacterium HR33]